MGFINLELYIRDAIASLLNEVQEEEWILEDLFSDLSPEDIQEVKLYLQSRQIVTDMNDVMEEGSVIYVIESFPLAGLPFPQIGIYLGSDDGNEFFLGGSIGEPTKAIKKGEATIAWEQREGYYAAVNYRADIIANTKAEVIWLSRLAQLAIARRIDDLESRGVIETRLAAADTKPAQEHYPAIVFSRAVMLSGKSLHTWAKRKPVGYYETGINTATI